MAITAAEIEANGWVLRLTLTAALTSPATNFSGYVFDASAASPRLVVAMASPGYSKSAGVAAADTRARYAIGLRALRKVVNSAAPTTKIIDETDLGGGSIRVRIALSEPVYSSDTGLTLDTLAGWRTGEAAQSGVSVTNSSAIAAPVPIMRWVLPSYEVATGSFRLSLLVASHHPVGFDPVAGVKFTVTDGTTVKTIWATALATDNSYGDNLRCHSVLVDPATATALTAGLLRCDAEVYPYLGAMRSTDPAGTRSMTTIRSDGIKTVAQNPFVIGYDPAGDRYSSMLVYVDPVNGTTTPAAGMVQTTLAGAKAVAAASRAKDVTTAIQAGRLVGRTLAAANGQSAETLAVDGLRMILAVGTHVGYGATSIGTTITCKEIPPVVEGDPDDASPLANCIMQTAASAANTRCPRFRVRRHRIEGGTTALTSSSVLTLFVDGMEIRSKAGSEAVTTAPIATGAPANAATDWSWCVTNTKVWKTGFALGGANRQILLLRACQNSRRATGTVLLKNRWITPAEDGFTVNTSTPPQGYGNTVQSINLGHLEDVFVAWNDGRGLRMAFWTPVSAPAALAGTTLNSYRRLVILNNLMERVSGTNTPGTVTSDKFYGFGEAELVEMTDIIDEFNTLAGGGKNVWYNDPLPVNVGETDSQNNIATRIRHANNAVDRNASKQDDFSDPDTLAIRTAGGVPSPTGYRPQLVGTWSTHFGTGMEAHVDCGRRGSYTDDLREGVGLRGNQYILQAPGWMLDASEAGTDAGGGDYTPLAGSVFLGRVRRGNTDRDFAGNARVMNGASGAFEGPSAPAVSAGVTIDVGGAVSVGTIRQVQAGAAVLAGGSALAQTIVAFTALATIAAGGSVAASISRGLSIAISVDAGGGASVEVNVQRGTVEASAAVAGNGGALLVGTIRSGFATAAVDAGGDSVFVTVTFTAPAGLMQIDLPSGRLLDQFGRRVRAIFKKGI